MKLVETGGLAPVRKLPVFWTYPYSAVSLAHIALCVKSMLVSLLF